MSEIKCINFDGCGGFVADEGFVYCPKCLEENFQKLKDSILFNRVRRLSSARGSYSIAGNLVLTSMCPIII